MALVWPAPKALEGAKSKNRAIFKIEPVGKIEAREKIRELQQRINGARTKSLTDAELRELAQQLEELKATVLLEDSQLQAAGRWASKGAGLALTLESRVVALGSAGRLLAGALAGDEKAEAVEGLWRHKGLAVARLGGHLAAPEADALVLIKAVDAALKVKPQVVVLEEQASGSAAWPAVFHALLRSEGLSGFGGAIVVCCQDETFAARRLCSHRWFSPAEGVLIEEAMTGRQLELVEDVLQTLKAAQAAEDSAGKKKGGRRSGPSASEALEALVEEARALADFQFEGDLLASCKKEKWTLTFLVEVTLDGSRAFRGFMCHRILPAPRAEFYIERISVPKQCRGKGYARDFLRWAEEEARRLPASVCSKVSCHALDTVVSFYEKMGFVVATCPEKKEVCDEDPQTFMECCLVRQVD